MIEKFDGFYPSLIYTRWVLPIANIRRPFRAFEFSLFTFHSSEKYPLSNSLTINDLITLLGFQKSRDKEIRYFSSGMRQRLKLALAICSNSPILLLDEPTTNLDVQGVEWYRGLMQQYTEGSNRLVIIASNAEHDYDFCDATLNILDFKSEK